MTNTKKQMDRYGSISDTTLCGDHVKMDDHIHTSQMKDTGRRTHRRRWAMVMASVATLAVVVVLSITTTKKQSSSSSSLPVSSSLQHEVLLPPHFLRTHPTAYGDKNKVTYVDDKLIYYGDDDIRMVRDKPYHRHKKTSKTTKNEEEPKNEEGEKEVDEEEEVPPPPPPPAAAAAAHVAPDEFTPILGFTADLLDASSPSQMHWYCEPGRDLCKNTKSKSANAPGWWGLVASSYSDTYSKLLVSPPALHDFWRYTFYEPTLLKDDGSFLYTAVPQSSLPLTVETSFTLHNPFGQFDAAGIMIRLDPDHWIKTGIEVVDGQPRVSVVVTNTYSDWSTESYGPPIGSDGILASSVKLRLRVHMLPRHGGSFVVEIVPYDYDSDDGGDGDEGAAQGEDSTETSKNWIMMRMAHLNNAMVDPTSETEEYKDDKYYEGPAAPDGTYMVGVYASSPVGSGSASPSSSSLKDFIEDKKYGKDGGSNTNNGSMVAVFHSFSVSQGSDFDQGGF